MTSYKVRSLLVGSFCVALLSTQAYTDSTLWEKHMGAAQKAYQEGRYADAENSIQAALEEAERFGTQDPRLAEGLNKLGEIYLDRGKYAEAEPLFRRSLAIREKVLGPEHPNVATVLENCAALLRMTKREDEAAKMEARAMVIRAKHARQKPTIKEFISK